MKKLLLAPLVLLLLASCSKIGIIYNEFTNEKKITSFALLYGNDTIKMNILDSTIEGIKRDTGSKTAMVALFTFKGRKVRVAEASQTSGATVNDFTNPVSYVVEAEDGSLKIYKVKLRSFTGWPILYVTSPPITSKEDYVNGSISINGNIDYANGTYAMQIKGRGNSTWIGPKKPYKIKLIDKAGLFGFPSDKEWALLANCYDKGLLRNDVAFELSERLKASWTPKRKFVEVFLNGVYNGNYLLTETIKSGKDRVNIDTKNGGYLLEVNFKDSNGDPRFWSNTLPWPVPVDVKEGSIATEIINKEFDSLAYKVQNYMFDPVTGYQSDFDMEALVTWYLVNEIMLNNDSQFYSSTYLQKDNATSKLKMGAVWDFDASSGNYNYGDVVWNGPDQSMLRNSVIISYLWSDPAFQSAIKAKWNKYRNEIMSIPDYIDAQAYKLSLSSEANYKVWDINAVYSNTWQLFGTYKGEAGFFKDWMTKRVAWMDKDINK